jgi:hypothetical protein
MRVNLTHRTSIVGVVVLATCLSAIVRLAVAGDSDAPPDPGDAASEPTDPPPVATSSFASTVIRAGLGADALAAAGVSAQNVAAIVAACESAHAQDSSALADADGSLATCRAQIGALQRVVRSGRGSEADVQSLQALVAEEEQAEADRAAALDALFAGATSGLTQAQRTTLAAIRQNRHWRFPVQYLVVDRLEAQWVRLGDALGEERGAARMGDEPRAEFQTFLNTVRADAAVAAATANLESHRAGVESAWNLALSD